MEGGCGVSRCLLVISFFKSSSLHPGSDSLSKGQFYLATWKLLNRENNIEASFRLCLRWLVCLILAMECLASPATELVKCAGSALGPQIGYLISYKKKNKELSRKIGELSRKICLSGCEMLKHIPEIFFEEMKNLVNLDLSHTPISSLPSSHMCLENLRTLCLDGSGLRDASLIGKLSTLGSDKSAEDVDRYSSAE